MKYCPLTNKECNSKNCRMSITIPKDGISTTYCAFCEFFIDKIQNASIATFNNDGFEPGSVDIPKPLTQKMTEELINKFVKENKYKEKIKKLVQKECEKMGKDGLHINYHSYSYSGYRNNDKILDLLDADESLEKFILKNKKLKELKEHHMISSFEETVRYVLIQIASFERNINHLDEVKKQKEQIPIYIEAFSSFAKEHDITKFSKKQLEHFCTISGITIPCELNSAFNTLAESELKRQKTNELGVREYVYFAQSNEQSDMVKIGYSKNPEKRIKGLNTGNPYKIKILKKIPGDIAREAGIHELFKDLKTEKNNEWFKYTDELKEFIKNIN